METFLLTLIRHAKSSWKHADLDDHDRPLNGRGRRDAPRMGERLRARGFAPDLILTSTALRARTTAEVIAGVCEVGERVRAKQALYHAGAADLLASVTDMREQLGHATRDIAVVGHEPGLGELVEMLTGDGFEHLPTCGVVTLEVVACDASDARLVSFETPKNDSSR